MKSDRLTVLITNIAFAFRSGTEIVVDQLARELARRGHRPIVFSPFVAGPLAEGLRQSGITTVDRLDQIGIEPDIIHGQHNVTTVMAMTAFPECPALFMCHDFDGMKDRPPLLPRLKRYVAVDEICRERLIHEGVPSEKIVLLHNAVDLKQFARRAPLPERPQRALVLTKGAAHLPVAHAAMSRAGLAWDEAGGGMDSVVDDLPQRLASYDLVIATARMAKEAIAAGCAVIVCDHRGFAGLVTRHVVAEWRRHNFGRRLLTHKSTEEGLMAAIAAYDAADAAAVTDFIRAEDALDLHVERLERIYRDVIAEPSPPNPVEDMRALSAFLEDFLISRNFSRAWTELYRNVVGEAVDVLDRALARHTNALQTQIVPRRGGASRQQAPKLSAGGGHNVRMFDLDGFELHGDATAHSGNGLAFTTPTARWQYALTLRCPLAFTPTTIEIDAEIESGAIGFGLNGPDLRTFLGPEIVLSRQDGRQSIQLRIEEDDLPGQPVLVIRNVNARGPSHGTIFGVVAVTDP